MNNDSLKQATLHQLQIFESVARHKSFTKAGDELFLTQPTVSQQMKQLTKAIGLPLYEQIGKKLSLTEAGEAVLSISKEISEKFEILEMILAELKGLKQGRLRIGTITTAKYFVPRLLGPFRQRYPGIRISLQIANRQQIIERINNNLDDLYFMGEPPDNLEINLRPVLENPLVVIAPRTHPLVNEKNIPLQRIAQEPLIMREKGSGTRMAIEQFFCHNRLNIKVEMEIGSNEAIKQAVVGGLGISILSRHSLALEGIHGPLTMLDVEGFPIQKHWYVLHLKQKQLSIVTQTFLDYLFSEGREIAEQMLVDIT